MGDMEQEILVLHVRWTVDFKARLDSPVFRFQGDEWRLSYSWLYENDDEQHYLDLQRMTMDRCVPLEVSVQVGRRGIAAEGLSQKGRFEEYQDWKCIWQSTESEIERWDPEYRTDRQLRFLVKLTKEDALATDVTSTTTQTEDTRESPVSATTSVQAESHLPGAPGQPGGTASTSLQTTLLLNTPGCLESLSQDLSKMLDQGSDPDVEFQCGDYSTRAHGALVSVRSEVIGSMLASDMVEGRTRVVKIPNMEPEVFQHFLRYLYTGTLPELTADLALNLYEAGDQYAVLGLARRCSQYLLEHLSVQDACDVLVIADTHGNEAFRESVIRFMLDKQVPLSGADWLDFCDAHPKLATKVLNRFCLQLSQRIRNELNRASLKDSSEVITRTISSI